MTHVNQGKKKNESTELYTIRKDVECLSCSSKGAVQHYGNYYPSGLGETTSKYMEKYKDVPHLSPAGGFGGTIPHQCLNCDRVGLIDAVALEGYRKQFTVINT